MSTRLLITALAASLLWVASNAPAAKELYRWTDEKGVVHYSDTKPTDTEFERRDVIADPAKADTKATAANPANANAADQATGEVKAEPSANCLQARANVDLLEKSPQVSMDTDNDGTAEVLGVDEQKQELARQRELAKLICKD